MEKRKIKDPRKTQSLTKKNPCGLTSSFYSNLTYAVIPTNSIKPIRSKMKELKVQNNIWKTIQKQDMNYLIIRLEDTPSSLFNTIKRRKDQVKFKKVKDLPQKENNMKHKIREKQKIYENLLSSMLAKNKRMYIETSLPTIKYVSQNQLSEKINGLPQNMKFR